MARQASRFSVRRNKRPWRCVHSTNGHVGNSTEPNPRSGEKTTQHTCEFLHGKIRNYEFAKTFDSVSMTLPPPVFLSASILIGARPRPRCVPRAKKGYSCSGTEEEGRREGDNIKRDDTPITAAAMLSRLLTSNAALKHRGCFFFLFFLHPCTSVYTRTLQAGPSRKFGETLTQDTARRSRHTIRRRNNNAKEQREISGNLIRRRDHRSEARKTRRHLADYTAVTREEASSPVSGIGGVPRENKGVGFGKKPGVEKSTLEFPSRVACPEWAGRPKAPRQRSRSSRNHLR